MFPGFSTLKGFYLKISRKSDSLLCKIQLRAIKRNIFLLNLKETSVKTTMKACQKLY
jgi:hypothetical protein